MIIKSGGITMHLSRIWSIWLYFVVCKVITVQKTTWGL